MGIEDYERKTGLIKGESAMIRFGSQLGKIFKGGDILFLHGDLGAGKTTLTRGFLQGRGHIGAVKSPTYTFVEHYSFEGTRIYHFDLYRLGDGEELEYMGIRDYFRDDAICIIEWPEKAKGFLPKQDLDLVISYEDEGQRRIMISARTKRGIQIFNQLDGL